VLAEEIVIQENFEAQLPRLQGYKTADTGIFEKNANGAYINTEVLKFYMYFKAGFQTNNHIKNAK